MTNEELNKEEQNIVIAFRKLRDINPKGEFVIFDSTSYFSYDIKTGKRVILLKKEESDLYEEYMKQKLGE